MSISNNFLRNATIFSKVFDFCVQWHQQSKKFPKLDRYSLGQECLQTLVETVVIVKKAEFLTGQIKIIEIQKASEKLDLIKVLVRLTRAIEILEEKEYIVMEAELSEIGRMIGGWIRSLKYPEKKP